MLFADVEKKVHSLFMIHEVYLEDVQCTREGMKGLEGVLVYG